MRILQERDQIRTRAFTSPAGVIVANGAAMSAVLFHVFIDFHIGLFGASSGEMTLAQGANALQLALTAGGWTIALAAVTRGSRTGTACALAFAGIWGVLLNGVVAFLAAPPPSAAFPFQDIAHAGGLVLGSLAVYTLVQQLPRQRGRIHRGYLALTLAWLVLVVPLVGLFASPLMG